MRMLERYYKEITAHMAPEYAGRFLTDFVCVDITEATDWFFEDSPQEEWNPREDFPTVVPPWPNAWIEFERPKFINSNGRKLPQPLWEHCGAIILSHHLDKAQAQRVLEQDTLGQLLGSRVIDKTKIVGCDRKADIAAVVARGDRCEWLMIVNSFFVLNREIPFGLTSAIYLDHDGKTITEMESHSLSPMTQRVKSNCLQTSTDVLNQVIMEMSSGLNAFFFGLSMMHCKNVLAIPCDDPPAPVLKKREKKGVPYIKFKTLSIQPLRKQVIRERDADHDGERNTVKRALHIVRGHFKDYRESGLFGNVHGIYWWDMHVRGNAEVGKVIKDYQIKPKAH